MKTNLVVITYFIYLPVALVLTWYVAKTLFRNSIVYMKDIFPGRNDVADATNSLFRIGFYLLNVGFALYILKIDNINNTQNAIEALSYKIGGFSVYLGVMLFLNMYLFFRGRKVTKHAIAQKQ